jgi:drug/metabolite transporter (DMT)-like permease
MNNLFNYIFVVLIWGSSWFAITLQLGVVPVQVSLVYRFALATLISFLWCTICRMSLRFKLSDHIKIGALGLTLFCVNYICFYEAEKYTTSGQVAVIFSLLGVFNMINNRLFLGIKSDRSVLIATVIGVFGIVLTFWSDLVGHKAQNWFGAILTLCGTYSASLGNLLSSRLQKRGISVVPANTFGMLYGTMVLTIYCLWSGARFTFLPTTAYTGALVYLAVLGSVVAFGLYLSLVGRIGSDRAAYVSVLFPIVALGISFFGEHYRPTLLSFLGIIMILLGNVGVLAGKNIGLVRRTFLRD